MNEAQATEMQRRFSRMASRYRRDRGFLPPSVDECDLVQEALLTALECESKFRDDGRAKFSTYLAKPVLGRWADVIAKSHFGPSASVRCWRRKHGRLDIDYGEISIEVLAGDDGDWLEKHLVEEDSDIELSFFNLTMAEASDCLIDIRRQLKNPSDVGISWAKTRSKFHVCVTVCGRQQFVGQFKEKEAARAAKSAFLGSFMDAVLAAIEEESSTD